MKSLAFFSLFAVAASISVPFDPELNEYWDKFKSVFKKNYARAEEVARRVVWEQHVAEIVRHNLQADMGLHSYRKGLNEYSDLNEKEFSERMTCLRGVNKNVSSASSWLEPENIVLPDTLDWREKGYVTDVKNQADCGSCWAFSATGSLEGQQMKKTGKLVSLSEQNLIDCSEEEGNRGCNGGWMNYAFEYIKKNKGIDTEEAYPYSARNGKCHFMSSAVGATVTGYVNVPPENELALQKAIATVGPISVAINAGGAFRLYKNGVYYPTDCSNDVDDLTHAVLLVGYGSENGLDYWLVKNSWGSTWGINGYFKMARNKGNVCGIATKPSYPLV